MNKHLVIISLCAFTAGSAIAANVDWGQLPPAAKVDGVTFEKDIGPLMKASCVRCHGAERPKARLRLDTLEGVMAGSKEGPVVVAGDSAKSLLVKSISQLDPEIAMPPKPRGPRRGPGGPGGDWHPPGTNGAAMERHEGEHDGPPAPRGERGEKHEGEMARPAGGEPMAIAGTNTPAKPHSFGPPAKPLTAEQVGLVRAWIDQGAK